MRAILTMEVETGANDSSARKKVVSKKLNFFYEDEELDYQEFDEIDQDSVQDDFLTKYDDEKCGARRRLNYDQAIKPHRILDEEVENSNKKIDDINNEDEDDDSDLEMHVRTYNNFQISQDNHSDEDNSARTSISKEDDTKGVPLFERADLKTSRRSSSQGSSNQIETARFPKVDGQLSTQRGDRLMEYSKESDIEEEEGEEQGKSHNDSNSNQQSQITKSVSGNPLQLMNTFSTINQCENLSENQVQSSTQKHQQLLLAQFNHGKGNQIANNNNKPHNLGLDSFEFTDLQASQGNDLNNYVSNTQKVDKEMKSSLRSFVAQQNIQISKGGIFRPQNNFFLHKNQSSPKKRLNRHKKNLSKLSGSIISKLKKSFSEIDKCRKIRYISPRRKVKRSKCKSSGTKSKDRMKSRDKSLLAQTPHTRSINVGRSYSKISKSKKRGHKLCKSDFDILRTLKSKSNISKVQAIKNSKFGQIMNSNVNPKILSIKKQIKLLTKKSQNMNKFQKQIVKIFKKMHIFSSPNLIAFGICLSEITDLDYLDITKFESLFSLKEYKNVIQQITILSFQNLKISSQILEGFIQRSPIQILNLQNTQISHLGCFTKSVPELRLLNISQNRLNDLTGIQYCPKIVEVYADSNCINDISSIVYCTQIQILSLYDNMISSNSCFAALKNLKNLKILQMSQNPIVESQQLDCESFVHSKLSRNIITRFVANTELQVNIQTNQFRNYLFMEITVSYGHLK